MLFISAYHGTDGPLRVDRPYVSELSEYIIKAGQEIGYKRLDYNGEFQEGKVYIVSKIMLLPRYTGVRYESFSVYWNH